MTLLQQLPALDWKAQAIAAYIRQGREQPLRDLFVQQLHALTGRDVPAERVWVDASGRHASAAVDGSLFGSEHGQLVLMRPCVHCGTGTFASPPLKTQADLGYALAAWQPLHPDCTPHDDINERIFP
jgi:hypothetical protein